MEGNGTELKVLPLLRTPESRPTPIPRSGCMAGSRTALTSCHLQRTPTPQPPRPSAPYSKRHKQDNRQFRIYQSTVTMIPMLQQRIRFRPPGVCNPLTHATGPRPQGSYKRGEAYCYPVRSRAWPRYTTGACPRPSDSVPAVAPPTQVPVPVPAPVYERNDRK